MSPLFWKLATWGPAALGLGLVEAGLIVAWFRRAPRTRCPGAAGRLSMLLEPWRLLGLSTCGYPLAAIPRAADGSAICPECGRRHAGRELGLRRPLYREWLVTLGLILVLCVPALHVSRWVYRGEWTPDLPASVLLFVNTILEQHTPRCLREELAQRAGEQNLSDAQAFLAADLLLADLRDDDIPWNADAAMIAFFAMPPRFSIPALESALSATDYQERQLAAHVLRGMDDYYPSDSCIRVTIEGLSNDSFPLSPTGRMNTWFANAREGVRFLTQHVDIALPRLRAALRASDPQQRLLAATVLANAGPSDIAPEAAPVLIAALADNDVEADARQATAALVKLGALARPALEDATLAPDPQQRRLAALILRRITTPDAPVAAVPRHDPARISVLTRDATTLSLERALTP